MSDNRSKTLTLNKPMSTKRKLVGHEFMLQELKDKNAVVEIALVSDNMLSGKISNFDKYTVTLSQVNSIGAEIPLCIFKHAIVLIREVK